MHRSSLKAEGGLHATGSTGGRALRVPGTVEASSHCPGTDRTGLHGGCAPSSDGHVRRAKALLPVCPSGERYLSGRLAGGRGARGARLHGVDPREGAPTGQKAGCDLSTLS